ncbi:Sir2 histone deacetylase Hst2 [Umbelopsis nana]
MGGKLSYINFDFDDLDLVPEQLTYNPKDRKLNMAGDKTKSSSKAPKAATLRDSSIDAIAEIIKNGEAKKIMVMTGAGISTAAGIPDFRSQGTGLYDNLQKFNLPYAEAIFDIDYFLEKPEPFYALAKELFPGKFLPTKTHYFIHLLYKRGILLHNFTQNIDTLERLAGLPDSHLVEAHGSFASATCVKCNIPGDIHHVKQHILQSQIPRCTTCKDGLIKPDITFFGQSLPDKFYDSLDLFDQADLLIVIGTSLQVQPFASLVDAVNSDVPRLLINREPAGVFQSKRGYELRGKAKKKRDALWLGDCDAGVEKLAELLGWDKELDELHRKGHEELKARWIKEEEALEEPETLPSGKETAAEKETIDQLADELEKRLHVPETKEENKLSSGENLDGKAENSKEDKGKDPSHL